MILLCNGYATEELPEEDNKTTIQGKEILNDNL
jgi:hypothetical protein